MPYDDDRVSPVGNKTGNVFDDDWFAKNSSIKNVSNRAIRRFPHLL